MKDQSFKAVRINQPEELLQQLVNLLSIKSDHELTVNVLKQILLILEKYEKWNKSLPLAAMRSSGLIERLASFLNVDYEKETQRTEASRWALSVMIQISYLSPNEFSSQQIMYVIRLCHISVHLDNIQNQTGKPVSPEHKAALVRIQE